MVRDLLSLPAVPGRLLADIREIKLLVRELLATENDLTRTSEQMNEKVGELHTTHDRLAKALEELRGFNTKLDVLDGRMERMEHELRAVRVGMREITALLPDLGRGPIAKARGRSQRRVSYSCCSDSARSVSFSFR